MIDENETMQVVTFRLGDDYLACPISQVREIIQLEEVTPVPSTPPKVRGILNRRGEIITILDMPKVLGIGLNLSEDDSQLMILYSDTEDIGVMVSEVTEIPTVNTEDIEEEYDTSIEDGVSEEEIEERKDRYGPNRIEMREPPSFLSLFLIILLSLLRYCLLWSVL